LTQLAINLLASGVLLKYSREQEHEADDLAFTAMVKAGYDPRGLIIFFQTLLARRQENPNALQQLFATHPPSQDRIRVLSTRWWAERPPNLQVDSEEFRRMKAHLATLPPAQPMPKDSPQSPKR
jgi:predicted Zn-dependent protease